MRWMPILTAVFAGLLAACAGPRDRDANARDLDRAREERREQERLCELHATEGRPRDPSCPSDPAPPQAQPGVSLPSVMAPGPKH